MQKIKKYSLLYCKTLRTLIYFMEAYNDNQMSKENFHIKIENRFLFRMECISKIILFL